MTNSPPAKTIAPDKPPAILSLIGDTPLVEITRMDTGPCQLFVKLEVPRIREVKKGRFSLEPAIEIKHTAALRLGWWWVSKNNEINLDSDRCSSIKRKPITFSDVSTHLRPG